MVMISAEDVIAKLRAAARPDQVDGMARYGMAPEHRLGVSVPSLRRLAKEIGKSQPLALSLWKTGIPEARILASMIGDAAKLTGDQMEKWVRDIDSWDVCDQVCMNLFQNSLLARSKILDWSTREEEFVKRAAFALIACLAWHGADIEDREFITFLPIIQRAAQDERNFVKKGVNWALRNIGKRNQKLNRAAIRAAREMQRINSRAARWIASDAIRELETPAVQRRFQK